MAKAGLTVRRECRADAKAEHSEPTVRIRCGWRLSDKSYSGDNRLVLPKSPYRRQSSAPRCRLILSWGWRRSQGFGCSPIKKIRELGSDRLGVDTRSTSESSEPEESLLGDKDEMTLLRRQHTVMYVEKLTNFGKILLNDQRTIPREVYL